MTTSEATTAGPSVSFATWWGVLGFIALLSNAVWRLAPLAVDAITAGMSGLEWGLMGVSVAFMAYSEGYKGFHVQTAPRVVARGLALGGRGFGLATVLAPAFCMGLFGATRKRMIVSWVLVVLIVCAVIAVRMLPQPWRGIVDAGVVVGLAIGAASTLYFFIRTLAGHGPGVDPELGPAT